MKKTILLLLLTVTTGYVFAQKKTTTSAIIAFDASTSIDALPKAENKTGIGAIDLKTGLVQFEATVKNFAFSNPMIQEHFNGANWLKSDEFPKFTFNGKIAKHGKVKYKKDGVYNVTVKGDLTIKGVTKPLTTTGTVTVKDGAVAVSSNFTFKLSDFGIAGAPIDAGKVAKEPKVTVSANF
jgi:polyisoprenoid-binding protein YceI